MYNLKDIIIYIRRIVKTPSNVALSDGLIIDYINRFWLNDVDPRLQIFDLKKKIQFTTQPGVDQYNMPLYDVQVEGIEAPGTNTQQNIGLYPVYQGYLEPAFANGQRLLFQTQKNYFYNQWQNQVQFYPNIAKGLGGTQTYTIQIPQLSNLVPTTWPYNSVLVRGHVDMSGITNLGSNEDPPFADAITRPNPLVTSCDSKVFVTYQTTSNDMVQIIDTGVVLSSNRNKGILYTKGNPPLGNQASSVLGQETVDYTTGTIVIVRQVPLGKPINVQCSFAETGMPRACLFYNNSLTLRPVPDNTYNIELDAYLTPSAFINLGYQSNVQYPHMSEYISLGAARKILSDTGDIEQFNFYEPIFKEQETLVWKRSQRQWTSTRTQTIYSQSTGDGMGNSSRGGNI